MHLPIPVEVSWENFDNSFSFYQGGSLVNSYYLFESQKAYTVDGATVTATLSLAKPEEVALFHIPGIQDNLSDYIFYCQQVVRPVCQVQTSDASVSQSGNGTLSGKLVGYADADGAIFSVSLGMTAAKDYTFTLEGPHRTYTLVRKAKVLEPGKMYQFPPLDDPKWTVEDNPGFINGHAYVEMGDGLKWATMNVGASKPEDFGDYFAWGETAAKTDYSWATYKWMKEGYSDDKGITKYTFKDQWTSGIWYDGTTFLGDCVDSVEHKDFASYDYADDAARVNWGGSWRTPTYTEWTWLRDNCSWEWTTDYNGSGKAGMVVTSKVDGFDSNRIFLPAVVGRDGTSPDNAGSHGNYWSSSLSNNFSFKARRVRIQPLGVYMDNTDDRYVGLSVRPVSD